MTNVVFNCFIKSSVSLACIFCWKLFYNNFSHSPKKTHISHMNVNHPRATDILKLNFESKLKFNFIDVKVFKKNCICNSMNWSLINKYGKRKYIHLYKVQGIHTLFLLRWVSGNVCILHFFFFEELRNTCIHRKN